MKFIKFLTTLIVLVSISIYIENLITPFMEIFVADFYNSIIQAKMGNNNFFNWITDANNRSYIFEQARNITPYLYYGSVCLLAFIIILKYLLSNRA